MQEILNRLRDFVPQLIGALATLIIGYLVALIVSRVVRSAVRRSRLNHRLGRMLAGPDRSDAVEAAPVLGLITFWLIMLVVLLGVFQVLDLTLITQPLDQFLGLVYAYLPRLLGALILVLIAWIVATVIRRLLLRVLPIFRLDQRLAGDKPTAGTSLTRSIAEVAYALVWIVFLPAILGALGLLGLLQPVQHMIDELLAFLPHLFAAALLLLIGWFVARLVGRLVANLLAALGLDRFSERVGMSAALGHQRLSTLVGLLVSLLILLPVAISALQALQLASVTAPASTMLTLILAEVPRLVAAGLTLLIAYVVGRVLAPIITSLLAAAGFDTVPARLGLARSWDVARSPSALVGRLVLVIIMLFAAIAALQTIGFAEVAILVTQFTHLGGRILLCLIIFGIGLYLARLAAAALGASGVANAGTLAVVAQGAILVLAGAMALQELGLGEQIITLAFALTLGAIAVASAIAFGVGGRDVAGRELERFVERRRANDRVRHIEQ